MAYFYNLNRKVTKVISFLCSIQWLSTCMCKIHLLVMALDRRQGCFFKYYRIYRVVTFKIR